MGFTELDCRVRSVINHAIIDQGFAPGTAEVAEQLAVPETEVVAAYHHLAAEHGLVLHPQSTRIWVAHPFALSSTTFWVTDGHRGWWGNCGWCALGIAAMLDQADVTIHGVWGGEDVPFTLHVQHGELIERDWYLNFCVPAAHLWDNVIYTCAMQLLFPSEAAIHAWRNRHGITSSEALTGEQAWGLAKAWYGHYLDVPWRKLPPDEAQALFTSLGMTGPFWQ